jgi:hypothetical protein
MTPTHSVAEAAYAYFSHARFARALSLITIGSALSVQMLRSLLGPAGLSALLIAELVLTAAMLLARRRVVKWSSFFPISLGLFLGWLLLSYIWSYYPKASIAGMSSQLTFTALALGVAASRDTIQIVRAVGDVLRVYLAASLILEIFSGVLIDTPIAFLGISGNLTTGNGIQGIFGSRNALSVIALIALITFFIELRRCLYLVSHWCWALPVFWSLACWRGQPDRGWRYRIAVSHPAENGTGCSSRNRDCGGHRWRHRGDCAVGVPRKRARCSQ